MKIRSWYGLSGEIEVENQLWHLVKIHDIPLHHPPVVNLFLRMGLPASDRLRLSFLHEFGHFQTLPFALLHLLVLISWAARSRPTGPRAPRMAKILLKMFLAHEAAWELAAEGYVLIHDGKAYLATYRKHPNPFLFVFWTGMSALAVVASRQLLGSAKIGKHTHGCNGPFST